MGILRRDHGSRMGGTRQQQTPCTARGDTGRPGRRAAQGSGTDQADLRALVGAGTLTAFTATSVAAAMFASAISAT